MVKQFADFDRTTGTERPAFGLVSPNFFSSITTLTSPALPTEHSSVQPTDGFMSDGRSGTINPVSDPLIVAQLTEFENPSLNAELAIANQTKRDANTTYEQHLCQIGADLHDGPAQLLALALLHIDALNATEPTSAVAVRDAVAEALRELRDISVGLVLPELEHANAATTVRLAVDNYHRRTGRLVTIKDAGLPAAFNPSKAIKICLYRIIQEGLQNGFKHASGSQQSVIVGIDPPTNGDATTGTSKTLVVIVRDSKVQSDNRPTSCNLNDNNNDNCALLTKPERAHRTSTGIGLAGLKERIGALNGTFEIKTTELGTELVAKLAVITNN
jgi:signal transduction histidine kinase